MASRTLTVGSSSGLHARPATLVTQAAAKAGVPVRIGRPGSDLVDASSILSLMSLGIGAGEQVELEVEGDEEVLDSLAALIESDLDS